MGANFCARISYNQWKEAKKFYLSGKKEQIAKIIPTPQSFRKCHQMGIDNKPIKVRFIRVELESGETKILVTSLKDMAKYPHEYFSDLYHLRWPVEEDYKTLKYRIQIENFSGKTYRSVYQDFHAKVFSKNFTAVVASTTKKQIQAKSENLKHLHQINFTQALVKMKHTIVHVFHQTDNKLIEIICKLRKIFIQTTESVRPNRKFPRRHRVKQQRFFYEYKTNR
ncbi:transposase [Desulfosarcina ovata]|uniref:transposase n=1 Tax=Desulfosarcina ovata TaxID=83564 RepID=UPI001E466223|nr:transposase [Desulfosarcina ovata]